MLYILFSPSEAKTTNFTDERMNNLLFTTEKREKILYEYNKIITSGEIESVKNLFGLKKESDIYSYTDDIFSQKTTNAISRYCGVAYEYLDFNSLNDSQKDILLENTIIFSNLFGPLRASDKIPNYKVKQGNSINDIKPEKYYNELFKNDLDLLLSNCDILDLRAGYYNKFYKVKQPYTTLKFLKNGKSVSHWAKAYRGLVLRAIATNACSSLEEFNSINIERLSLHEIKIVKNHTEIIYNLT
ncbi:MAG: peroxide stress protein YaaA [Campylobacterota bacterium]|nr:peroxide stress protein YaaA [Campylobacterota bacterium]